MNIIKPSLAIEIGTNKGGSLSAISSHCKKTISIDLNPDCAGQLHNRLTNVTFLTGSSKIVLPQILRELSETSSYLEFVLVDGDHSREGVLNDISSLLDYTPKKPLYILMHDSFNPDVRKGICDARWEDNLFVHGVEIDFTPGYIIETSRGKPELWGGLALALILPEKRTRQQLQITSNASTTYRALSQACTRHKWWKH